MEESEWKLVAKKAARGKRVVLSVHQPSIRYKQLPAHRKGSKVTSKSSLPDPTTWKEQIEGISRKLEQTKWWSQVIDDLEEACRSTVITCLKCYGVGSFVSSSNARHQLACALLLKRKLETCEYCIITDPAMNITDKEVAALCGFNVEEDGSQNMRIDCERGTLFFMPHCSRFLFDRVLEDNENVGYSRMIIFGNSLRRYVEIRSNRAERTIIDELYDAGALVERPCLSAKLSTSENAFNDLSITTVSLKEKEQENRD